MRDTNFHKWAMKQTTSVKMRGRHRGTRGFESDAEPE